MAIVDVRRRDSRAVGRLAAALLVTTVSACGGETASSIEEAGVADVGANDVSQSPDVSAVDVWGMDVSVVDVSVVDAVADATDSAVADARSDGGGIVDASPDAPEDIGTPEAAGSDSGFDAGLDATTDVEVDAPAESCPPGQVVCTPSGCTDLQTDPNNCGSCGNSCPVGASCQLGNCQCPVGQVVCENVCADLQNDPGNCGSCGNNCNPETPQGNPPGGYCELGVCHEPVMLGPGDRGLALDRDNVYTGSIGSWDAGAVVWRIPKDGGASTMLASNQGTMMGLAVDSQNVYWATDATVASVPLAGGTPTTLATGQGTAYGVAVDANNVYWTDYVSGTVMSVPIGGGSPTTLASGWPGASGIVVDSTNVYWAAYYAGIGTVPVSGGSATPFSGAAFQAQAVALDSTNLYFTGGNGVFTVPLGGGTATNVSPRQGGPALAVDATKVYFAYDVSCVNKDGTGFLYLSNGAPWAIAVDSTSVYWTDQNIGAVFKIDKP